MTVNPKLSRLLCAGFDVVLMATGCAGPRPLKGGKAVTTRKPTGIVEQTLVQGENPAQATKQDHTHRTRQSSFALPAFRIKRDIDRLPHPWRQLHAMSPLLAQKPLVGLKIMLQQVFTVTIQEPGHVIDGLAQVGQATGAERAFIFRVSTPVPMEFLHRSRIRIPPARAFALDGVGSSAPRLVHLFRSERAKTAERFECRLLLIGKTQPQQRYVGAEGRRVMQALSYRQARQEQAGEIGLLLVCQLA